MGGIHSSSKAETNEKPIKQDEVPNSIGTNHAEDIGQSLSLPLIPQRCRRCYKLFDTPLLADEYIRRYCSLCTRTRLEIVLAGAQRLNVERNSADNHSHGEGVLQSQVSPAITQNCCGCNNVFEEQLLADEFGKHFCRHCLKSQREIKRSRLEQQLEALKSTAKQQDAQEAVRNLQLVTEAALLRAEFGIEGMEKLLRIPPIPVENNCIELFSRSPQQGSVTPSQSNCSENSSFPDNPKNPTQGNNIRGALASDFQSSSTCSSLEAHKFIKPVVVTGASSNPDLTRPSKMPPVSPQPRLGTAVEQVAHEVGKAVGFHSELLGSTKAFPSDQDLRKYFERFGVVEAIHRSRKASNGFILFESCDAAKAALFETYHEVSGCHLTLKSTNPGFKLPKKKKKKKKSPSTPAAIVTPVAPVTSGGIIFFVDPPPLIPGEPSNGALSSYFGKFGRILSLEKEATCPVGHVFFNSVEEAEKCLAEENHFVGGHCILVYPSKRPMPEKKVDASTVAAENPVNFVQNSCCIRFQTLTKQSKCVPPTNDALKEYFKKFGLLVAFYKDANHPNGFVKFANMAAAQKAILTKDHVVNGCELKIILTYNDISLEEKYINTAESEVVKCCRLVFQALVSRSKVPCPSDEALRSHFEKFGQVVGFYRNPKHPSGSVVFNSLNDAKRTFLAPEHVVNGCIIKLMPTSRYF